MGFWDKLFGRNRASDNTESVEASVEQRPPSQSDDVEPVHDVAAAAQEKLLERMQALCADAGLTAERELSVQDLDTAVAGGKDEFLSHPLTSVLSAVGENDEPIFCPVFLEPQRKRPKVASDVETYLVDLLTTLFGQQKFTITVVPDPSNPLTGSVKITTTNQVQDSAFNLSSASSTYGWETALIQSVTPSNQRAICVQLPAVKARAFVLINRSADALGAELKKEQTLII